MRFASGSLRQLNIAYREGRAAAAQLREPFPSYGDYLAQFKIKMLCEIASASH